MIRLFLLLAAIFLPDLVLADELDPNGAWRRLNPQFEQEFSGFIQSDLVQVIVVHSIFPVMIALFWTLTFAESAFKQGNALVTTGAALIVVMITATGIRFYDHMTGAGFALGNGFYKLVIDHFFGGESPMVGIIAAMETIHSESKSWLGIFDVDLMQTVGMILVTLAVYALGAVAWIVTEGAIMLFVVAKVVGYFALPFVLFKPTSRYFSACVGLMVGSIVLQMMAPLGLYIIKLMIDHVIFITGGFAMELSNLNPKRLVAILAYFITGGLMLLGLSRAAYQIAGSSGGISGGEAFGIVSGAMALGIGAAMKAPRAARKAATKGAAF